MKLMDRVVENQSFEKSALIVAGTTLISVGTGIIVVQPAVGLGVLALGVICLIARELVKLKE